jgi:release factor glutamine methyltransferase
MEKRIEFRQADLLSGFSGEHFDFAVSNPPYIPESEVDSVEAQVRKFEPHAALFAGEDGMAIYRRLIPQASDLLKPDGWLVIEIGSGAAEKVRTLLHGWRDVRMTNDLQGIPRVVAARR